MINIFNIKQYFKRIGDNQRARVGHVNHLFPLTGNDNPIDLGITPSFLGQRFLQTDRVALWIAQGTTSNDWVQYQLD